ncbi:unnamed protein product [Trifolium pratense]|uniref:Uncharacterized protein n=1 Tax=Trifolium pratense TaxID=57577 RepID=A0ACB0M9Y3_TRIPR|nr:unnamed protein product [Trifolium pratense]
MRLKGMDMLIPGRFLEFYKTIDLSSNFLTQGIPVEFGKLVELHSLNLSGNQLVGSIPSRVIPNCWTYGTNMIILNLANNNLKGEIPKLSLRILDLSENQLKGEIPRCVFPAMATDESINEKSYMEFLTIKESFSIYLYEKKSFYGGQFANLKIIDLSSNLLTHGIPVAIGKLVELQVLNLSRNQLVGSIPSNIGEMQSLEFLDLSMNHLSCAIPTSMANIDRLVMLDLSYNTLSGKIPIGTRLQAFDGSSFEGNPHLCGEQLDKACPRNNMPISVF